jgi:mevalonate pyrophosphate decarboxylase
MATDSSGNLLGDRVFVPSLDKADVLSVTVQLPYNIPLIKFWGLRDEERNLPLNATRALCVEDDKLFVTASVCTRCVSPA